MLDFTKPAAQASPLKFRTITHRFGGEGRYTLLLRPREPEPEAPEKHRRPAGLDPQKFYVYAVEADLFRLRPWVPWVGDMDVHSFHSDGREILDIHSRAA